VPVGGPAASIRLASGRRRQVPLCVCPRAAM